MIISPCVSICKTDPVTGYCYGCSRTNEEKKIWEDEKTTEEWKKSNLEKISKNLNSFQRNKKENQEKDSKRKYISSFKNE